jgi:hypothetical protein
MSSVILTLFEKSDDVLWAFLPNGIILHQFSRRQFIELEGIDADIWRYCDGTRNGIDMSVLIAPLTDRVGAGQMHEHVASVLASLFDGGFVVPCANGHK